MQLNGQLSILPLRADDWVITLKFIIFVERTLELKLKAQPNFFLFRYVCNFCDLEIVTCTRKEFEIRQVKQD